LFLSWITYLFHKRITTRRFHIPVYFALMVVFIEFVPIDFVRTYVTSVYSAPPSAVLEVYFGGCFFFVMMVLLLFLNLHRYRNYTFCFVAPPSSPRGQPNHNNPVPENCHNERRYRNASNDCITCRHFLCSCFMYIYSSTLYCKCSACCCCC